MSEAELIEVRKRAADLADAIGAMWEDVPLSELEAELDSLEMAADAVLDDVGKLIELARKSGAVAA